MKSVIAILVLAVAFAAAEEDPCKCTKESNPLCGSDGVTYSNPCVLRCHQLTKDASVQLAYYGTCDEPEERNCPVPAIWMPVCGSNGKTYVNKWALKCDQELYSDLELLHVGQCVESREPRQFCPCPYVDFPICASNGVTYFNVCFLDCAQKEDPSIQHVHYGHCY